jgi:hypothetical protein
MTDADGPQVWLIIEDVVGRLRGPVPHGHARMLLCRCPEPDTAS